MTISWNMYQKVSSINFLHFIVTGILDANMGDIGNIGDIDINFDDIEVDVEYFGTSTKDKNDSFTVDLDALMIKNEPEDRDTADNDIEVETVKKDALKAKEQPDKSNEKDAKNDKEIKFTEEKKKKEPSVTVNISYKDIQVTNTKLGYYMTYIIFQLPKIT